MKIEIVYLISEKCRNRNDNQIHINEQIYWYKLFIIDQPVYDAGLFLFSEGKQNYTLYIKAKYAEGIFMSIQGREREWRWKRLMLTMY